MAPRRTDKMCRATRIPSSVTLPTLPDDVWRLVFARLRYRNRQRLSRVAASWRSYADDIAPPEGPVVPFAVARHKGGLRHILKGSLSWTTEGWHLSISEDGGAREPFFLDHLFWKQAQHEPITIISEVSRRSVVVYASAQQIIHFVFPEYRWSVTMQANVHVRRMMAELVQEA